MPPFSCAPVGRNMKTRAHPTSSVDIEPQSKARTLDIRLRSGFSPDPNDFERVLTARLRTVTAKLSATALRLYLNDNNLTIAQWSVLLIVTARGPITMNEIGRAASMDKAFVSRAAFDLLRRRLIKRVLDPQDRRKSILTATPKGKSLRDQVRPLAIRRQQKVLDMFDDNELATLDRILRKLATFSQAPDGH